MRSILLLVALCGLFFTACQPDEPATFSVEVTPTSFSETISPTGTKVMTANLKNESTVSGTVDWSFTETSMVAGWTYSIVVGNTQQSSTTGSFELVAGGSIDLTISAMPNGTAGVGKAELSLKNGSDALETISYTVDAVAAAAKFSLSTNNEGGTDNKNAPKVEYKSKVKNLTNSDLNLTWTRVNDSNTPGGWNVDVCDIVQCYAPFVNTADFTIPANGEFDLKIGFNASGTPGTGAATVDLFETGDVGTTQQFTATHTATN